MHFSIMHNGMYDSIEQFILLVITAPKVNMVERETFVAIL